MQNAAPLLQLLSGQSAMTCALSASHRMGHDASCGHHRCGPSHSHSTVGGRVKALTTSMYDAGAWRASMTTHPNHRWPNSLVHEFLGYIRDDPCRGVVLLKCPFCRVCLELTESFADIEAVDEYSVVPLVCVTEDGLNGYHRGESELHRHKQAATPAHRCPQESVVVFEQCGAHVECLNCASQGQSRNSHRSHDANSPRVPRLSGASGCNGCSNPPNPRCAQRDGALRQQMENTWASANGAQEANSSAGTSSRSVCATGVRPRHRRQIITSGYCQCHPFGCDQRCSEILPRVRAATPLDGLHTPLLELETSLHEVRRTRVALSPRLPPSLNPSSSFADFLPRPERTSPPAAAVRCGTGHSSRTELANVGATSVQWERRG